MIRMRGKVLVLSIPSKGRSEPKVIGSEINYKEMLK